MVEGFGIVVEFVVVCFIGYVNQCVGLFGIYVFGLSDLERVNWLVSDLVVESVVFNKRVFLFV